MNNRWDKTIYAAALACLLSGCASAPNWQRPDTQDKETRSQRLTVDDNYCTLVSYGAAQMPPITVTPTTPTVSNVTMRGTTYDSSTGARTYGTYTGQVTTAPSGGFAGGFASGLGNGAALGAAIAAQRQQDALYKACMNNKGWVDANEKNVSPVPPPKEQSSPSLNAPTPYPNAEVGWESDTAEFMRFFPEFQSGHNFETLNAQVKNIAKLKTLDGPQYLIEALESIKPEAIKIAAQDTEDVMELYLKAVKGNARAQAGLGLAYVQEKDPRTPLDPRRSAYWSRKSALAGNSVGQLGYGILLFSGSPTGQPDRVLGYRWVQKAGMAGLKVEGTLQGFRQSMSGIELQQVR